MHSPSMTQPGSSDVMQRSEDGSDHENSAVLTLESKQTHAEPEVEGHTGEASGNSLTAALALTNLSASTAESAGPMQAPMAAAPDQQAATASREPASAAAASESRPAETAAADEHFLHPEELKVAAALLVVLQRATREGHDAVKATEKILLSNMPQISLFLQQQPESGKLPSLKQLERSAPRALQRLLAAVTGLCAAAECQPLELFTRSTLYTTHFTAIQSRESGRFAERRNQLQAIAASLAICSKAERTGRETKRRIYDRVRLLDQHGVAQKEQAIMVILLREAISLLNADSKQLGEAQLTAGSASSFTACIDHMLPGEEPCTALNRVSRLQTSLFPQSMDGS